MTVGWVASSTRGRALVSRVVGSAGAVAIARADWPTAVELLGAGVAGRRLPPVPSRADARWAAIDATAWELRVLSGWLPPGQGSLVRLFGAPLEIAAIERHLAALRGGAASGPPVQLGALSVALPRVRASTTPEQIRQVLSTSVWGDPGGSDAVSMALGLRLGLARRAARWGTILGPWARGAAAVIVARERFSFGRPLPPTAERVAGLLLGRRWRGVTTVADFVDALPETASWPLVGIDDPVDLWRAEGAVVRRIGDDAESVVAAGRPTRATVIGVMALLLVDLWRTLAAIELAGRGPVDLDLLESVGVVDAVV